MTKLLIKKKCINECGRYVMLKREEHGTTPAEECGTCKSLGKKESIAEFANLTKKSGGKFK